MQTDLKDRSFNKCNSRVNALVNISIELNQSPPRDSISLSLSFFSSFEIRFVFYNLKICLFKIHESTHTYTYIYTRSEYYAIFMRDQNASLLDITTHLQHLREQQLHFKQYRRRRRRRRRRFEASVWGDDELDNAKSYSQSLLMLLYYNVLIVIARADRIAVALWFLACKYMNNDIEKKQNTEWRNRRYILIY